MGGTRTLLWRTTRRLDGCYYEVRLVGANTGMVGQVRQLREKERLVGTVHRSRYSNLPIYRCSYLSMYRYRDMSILTWRPVEMYRIVDI